eukprot:2991582-Rhodomonas_salina.1
MSPVIRNTSLGRGTDPSRASCDLASSALASSSTSSSSTCRNSEFRLGRDHRMHHHASMTCAWR